MITLRDVSLDFGNVTVFKALNFNVMPGQIVCIRTGVLDGGSSLLKLCGGIITPDKGEVLIDNKKTSEYRDDELFNLVSFCHEQQGLISIFSNYNNIVFPIAYHSRTNMKELNERIHHIATKFALADYLDGEPHQLNDVQHRLFNLMRALVIRPKILLLDEVQAGFSNEYREKVLAVLLEEKRLHDYTVLMTVSAGDETKYADHVYAINDMKLEQER